MTHRINNIYTFDIKYETSNWPFHLRLPFNSNILYSNLNNSNDLNQTQLNLPHWRPSSKLQKLYDKF